MQKLPESDPVSREQVNCLAVHHQTTCVITVESGHPEVNGLECSVSGGPVGHHSCLQAVKKLKGNHQLYFRRFPSYLYSISYKAIPLLMVDCYNGVSCPLV